MVYFDDKARPGFVDLSGIGRSVDPLDNTRGCNVCLGYESSQELLADQQKASCLGHESANPGTPAPYINKKKRK
jgi:hypothetical protein